METNTEIKPGLISISTLLREANNIYRTKFRTLISITVIPSVVVFAGVLIGIMGLELLSGLFALVGATIGILSTIALVFVIKDNIGVREAYSLAFGKFLSYIWVSSLAVLIIAGGFFMAIIPAIIFNIWFALAVYILIMDGDKGLNAILKSKEYVRGYWWPTFARVITIFLIVLGTYILITYPLSSLSKNITDLASPILQVFIGPFVVAYYVSLYRDFKRMKPNLVSATITERRKFFIFSAVLAIILIPLLIFGILVAMNIPAGLPL